MTIGGEATWEFVGIMADGLALDSIRIVMNNEKVMK